MPQTLSKNYRFNQVWDSVDKFISDFRESGLNKESIKESSLKVIYYQVYARHGADAISSRDKDIWRYKFFTIIYNKGGKWQTAMEKQNALEELEDNDITIGSKSINNFSSNPSDEPDGGTMDEDGLSTINNQGVNIVRINKIVSYNQLLNALKDVTSDFIRNFDSLFSAFPTDIGDYFYESEEEEN